MIRPMITSTTSISMSVKPAEALRRAGAPTCRGSRGAVGLCRRCHKLLMGHLHDDLVDAQQRGHDGKNEGPNDDANNNDGCRSDKSGQLVDLFGQFALIIVGATLG